MDNDFAQIKKAVKSIKLTEDEKFLMRQNILNNGAGYLPSQYRQAKSPYFSFYKFAPSFAMIMIVVLAGGTSAFAEKTVPGDFLYALKISVNEPVAGLFAFSKEEKTEWQERLVERRLGEAQKLVAQERLDEKTRTYLADKIQTQVDEFNISANELALQKNESANSLDLNVRLQASLRAHEGVLLAISNKKNTDSSTKQETDKLIAMLTKSQDRVRDSHEDIVSKDNIAIPAVTAMLGVAGTTADDKTSVLSKKESAQDLLNSIKLTYQKEKLGLSVNIQDKIDNKLAEVEKIIKEGNVVLESSDYANAAEKFQVAIDLANSAKLLMLSNAIKEDIEEDLEIEEEDSFDIEEYQIYEEDDDQETEED